MDRCAQCRCVPCVRVCVCESGMYVVCSQKHTIPLAPCCFFPCLSSSCFSCWFPCSAGRAYVCRAEARADCLEDFYRVPFSQKSRRTHAGHCGGHCATRSKHAYCGKILPEHLDTSRQVLSEPSKWLDVDFNDIV